MSLSPKRLFLIDGLGAVLSAFLLGVVLVSLEEIIGMPSKVLYFLALLACIFAVYSFWNYRNLQDNWQPYLKAIALANLTYCVLTIALVIFLRERLTTLGFLYFGLEVLVIVSLVFFELKYVADWNTKNGAEDRTN